MGIKPDEREFLLANGKQISRQLGGVRFEDKGYKGYTLVIFGEKGDSTILRAKALEAMGFAIDPLKRELISLRRFWVNSF